MDPDGDHDPARGDALILEAAALDWAARGIPVIPCHSLIPSGGCSCGSDSCGSSAKHPRTRGGVHDATCDEGQIREWWRRWPDASIGGAIGEAGLWVLDVDGVAGAASLSDWLRLRGYHLPPTTTTRTGGGGTHYWWRAIPRAPRNRVGLLPRVDVRSRGGYAILPPSLHASGRLYQLVDDTPIATPPTWLVDLVAPPPPPPPPPAHPRAWYPDGGASVRSRDPAERRARALELRATISPDGTSARGIRCPRCSRPSVWYAIVPERWYGAACAHRRSCGWSGALSDL